jgi:hypothetical protein
MSKGYQGLAMAAQLGNVPSADEQQQLPQQRQLARAQQKQPVAAQQQQLALAQQQQLAAAIRSIATAAISSSPAATATSLSKSFSHVARRLLCFPSAERAVVRLGLG